MDDSSFNSAKESILKTIKYPNQAYFGRSDEISKYNATCEVIDRKCFSNNFDHFIVLHNYMWFVNMGETRLKAQIENLGPGRFL